ncbi:MAG TPA: sugar transferase, partial [Sinorhizobium sp.]|nr:sugar transferase [Sinorhizobium sp.]
MKGFAWSSSRSYRRSGVAQRPVGGLVKRGFDIGGASLGLVFLGPLLLSIACLVAFADGGSIFQGHMRVGRGGCVFNCLRFRTTLEGAGSVSAMQPRPAAGEGANDTQAPAFAYEPYVTPVGAVLSRLGLDTLPQLINVLRGDMSIVGPRPVAPGELETLGSAAEFYVKSRPGLTGPW